MLSNERLQQLSSQVEPIVRAAGKLLLSYFHKQMNYTKKQDNSFVTEADLVTEKFLIKELSPLLPGAAFLAEESGRSGSGDYRWVIDSLDGTTNFARGLPYFCISVALTYDNQPILGVVYQPLLDEYFYAWHDGDAVLNGVPITVSKRKSISDSMIVVALPYAKDGYFDETMEVISKVASESYSFRYLGSVALDLAYVASGRIDGLFLRQSAWWDVAAGILLVQRARGLVIDMAGEGVRKGDDLLVATSPLLEEDLRYLIEGEQMW